MAKKAAVEGAETSTPATATSKVASLTFSTEPELAAYEKFAAAAKEDDRSVNSLLVRILMGKEANPAVSA